MLSIPFIIAFALLFAPIMAQAQTAGNFNALQTAINSFSVAANDMVITVTAGFSITSGLYIPANINGKTLTIKSANASNPVTLRRGNSGNLFTVNDEAKLVFENIIIDGDKDFYPWNLSGALVFVDGEFIMNDGAVLKNNNNRGVYINKGVFTMIGGEIIGNSARNGGGVYQSGGIFTMIGGEISGNDAITGGGVYVDTYADDWFVELGAIFTMNGGKISGNVALDDEKEFGNGGGVFVEDLCLFTMHDGEIRGNTAINGGGVFLSAGEFLLFSPFTKLGGEIIDNAAIKGGGVYVSSNSIFDIGGESVISGNTAIKGGGVYVDGFFNMTGGKIAGNYGDCRIEDWGWTFDSYGGGIYVSGSGEFDMNRGEISGNRAMEGGGVYVSYGGIFDLGGEAVISGNTAYNTGGGVFAGGSLTMTGGKISGNTATDSLFMPGVGGVSVAGGILTLGGKAVISDNTFGNVYLMYGAYITLGTGSDAPANGMKIGVQTESPDGVIVYHGASAGVERYFRADEPGYIVIFDDGKLVIDEGEYDEGPLSQEEINRYRTATEDMVMTVVLDSYIAAGLTIPANENGATLTIRGFSAENPVTITRDFAGAMFTVEDGAKLIFEDIIVDGNKDEYPDNPGALVLIKSGGGFTMKDGAVLRDNIGGGVSVSYEGAFTMLGGEIAGNSAYVGGGVLNYGEFTMTGGKITGNSAEYGGVFTDGGSITMLGGEISGNNADHHGVYIGLVNGFTLGGTAVIKNNMPNNVELIESRYIELGIGENAPAPGMEIWVTKAGNNGVIVAYGASAQDAAHFFADESGKDVVCDVGQLRIDVKAAFIFGDVSGDGVVDELDVVLLERYLARWPISINEASADVNSDGVIDEMDIVVLERYLARWPGYETLPIKPSPSPAIAMSSSLLLSENDEVTLIDGTPSASVKKLNGNMNELTMKVTERFSDGSTNTITNIISINNNAAGYYQVGRYVVYVETKGSDQIRQCYIVE